MSADRLFFSCKIKIAIICKDHATLIEVGNEWMNYDLVIIWELYRGNITKVHPQL